MPKNILIQLLDKMNREIFIRKLTKYNSGYKNKDILKICEAGGDNIIFNNILASIYFIETLCRPFYFRISEYLALVICLLLNIIFKKPIRNFTIGKCQLGLTTILNYYGSQHYIHLDYIKRIKVNEAIYILRIIMSDEYYRIFADKIRPIFNRANNIYGKSDLKNTTQYIGQQYNGKYTYGLFLTYVFEQTIQMNIID